MSKINPDTVFIPFPDRHIDHRVIFDSCVVACRPISKKFPQNVFIYETLSETHWNANYIEPNFVPDVFIDISKQYKFKEKALLKYSSQIKNNRARNKQAIKGLASFRGSQNNKNFCEAFKLIRINF